ncbi:MAG: ATP-binding protein [Mycobacteriales bacterium]
MDASVDQAGLLDEFTVSSEPGNERAAMARVAEAIKDFGLAPLRLERLKTAVAEATMNAIEHGNHNQADLPVRLRVLSAPDAVVVTISDQGGLPVSAPAPDAPDLEAKLAGLQTPRGWGLFLIKNMVDEMTVSADGAEHTVRLTVHLHDPADQGEGHAEHL